MAKSNQRESLMNKFEKIAILLVIAWLIALIFPFFADTIVLRFMTLEEYGALKSLQQVTLIAMSVITFLVQIVIGVWLYIDSKKKGNKPWVWLLFGFVFGINALILYYLIEIKNSYFDENDKVFGVKER